MTGSTWKILGLSIVLADFLALTAWALAEVGLAGLREAVTFSAMTILLSVDLVLALAVAMGWMVADARRRGRAWAPFVLLTLCTGSAGPLLYLIVREWSEGRAPSRGTGLAAAR